MREDSFVAFMRKLNIACTLWLKKRGLWVDHYTPRKPKK